MTSSMGDENDAAQRALVTDVAVLEGLTQIYDLQRSVAAQRIFGIK